MLSFTFTFFLHLIHRMQCLAPRRVWIKSSPVVVILIANCLFFSTPTEASMYSFDFTATDFTSCYWDLPAPQDTVEGSITFSSESLGGAPIDSILSVSLDIAGHRYTLDEIDWTTDALSSSYSFGGALNSINVIRWGTDDFRLHLNNRGRDVSMTYASSGVYDGWTTTNVIGTFRPVPLPPSFLLLGAGLIGLIGSKLRIKGLKRSVC